MVDKRSRKRLVSLGVSLMIGCNVVPTTWADATLDGSMGSTGSFSGNFTIPDTVGQTRGSNLFHSFSNFSINAGESATFTGPDAINNVVSRVTGNSPSTFNGPLNSAIPSANFYFLNPNGILFKEGAQINVDGSFYATTSDFIRLGQDGVFYADPATQSVLTSSPPSAFGFLDSNPGQIALEGTQLLQFFSLNQPGGSTFSLVGGDITLKEASPGTPTFFGTPTSAGSFLSAPGNRVALVSVASAGEAVLDNGIYDLSSFNSLGNIRIEGGSVVDATEVYIRGGKLVINNAIVAPGYFSLVGMAPRPGGGGVDIATSEQVSISGTAPLEITVENPNLGPITPTRPDSGPFLSGVTTFGGSGLPGAPLTDVPSIQVAGGDVSLSGAAAVMTERFGPGNAAEVNVEGETVEIHNGAFVGAFNFYEGSGGKITVTGDEVILDGEQNPGFTGISAQNGYHPLFGRPPEAPPAPQWNPFDPAYSTADSGQIAVTATGAGVTIKGGAEVTTDSRAFGRAGDITIKTTDATLSGDGAGKGSIASQSLYAGDAGRLEINASGDINIENGFRVSSSIAGTGNGGPVILNADGTISVTGSESAVASQTVTPPPEVEDGLAQLFGVATFDELVAILQGMDLVGPEADMFDALAALQTMGLIDLGDPDPTAGNAGPINLSGGALVMDGAARIDSSTTSDGDGGTVTAHIGSLNLTNGAQIRSRSGNIPQSTGELVVGVGNGGAIDLTVDGLASISGRTPNGSPSGITTSSLGDGNGGNISLVAGAVTLNDNGTISADSSGDGLAGDISINAGERLDMSGGKVTTQASISDGGNIAIIANERVYLLKSDITTSVESGFGGGGNIDIDPKFVILNQSNILANAFGGPGGNINIVAGNFIVTPDSVVDASSALGLDGTVNISSPDEEVADDLAVLPDNYLDVTSLMSERCGTTAGASSLVDAGPGGLAVDPDGYLPSFATATNQEDEAKGANQASLSGKRWWTLHADPALQLAQVTCTQ